MFFVMRRRGQRRGAAANRCRDRSWSGALEPRRLLSAGDLDASFNGTGQATVDFGFGTNAFAIAPAVQADGKTVVAGYAVGPAGKHIAVARFNVDGTLDRTFGPDHSGKVVTPVDEASYAEDLALQDDGKIVVVGRGQTDGVEGHMVVVRYTTDGSLDPTFDGNGKKAIDFPDDDSWATSVMIQAGGKILVAGGSHSGGILSTNDDFALARLNPDGSLDSSFDGDGKKLVGFGNDEQALAIATDYNGTPATNPHYGKIVAVGTSSGLVPGIDVARLNPGGSLDDTFDRDGQLFYRYGTNATVPAGLVLQDGGRIVIGATVNDNTMAMVRLIASGELDQSFGTGGSGWQIIRLVTGATERASDLIETPDGKLYLGGTMDGSTIVTPHTADGRPDSVFGVDGYTRAPFGGARRMAYGPGRRFVMASAAGFRVARFLDTGANVVRVATLLDPVAHEAGQDPASFFVYRSERLPYATRVYLDVGGSATAPTVINFRSRDYTADGIVFPNDIFGEGGPPYVDIPANQTFALVTLTPIQDTRVEGTETMVFTVRPGSGYEVGSPRSTELNIRDDDVALNASVAGRYVFYNGSAYDGNDPAAKPSDDAAVAPGKVAALPGQPLTFASATSYGRGLNGIMINVAGLPPGAGPTASDFAFQAGTDANEANWPDVPGPTSVLVRRGAGTGGSDRVTLAWDAAAGAARNAWLRVTVRANLTTGLATPDVFYFGNLIGDTGDTPAAPRVNALDMSAVRRALNTASGIAGPYDFNRDGRVNALDLASVKGNLNRALTAATAGQTASLPGPPSFPAVAAAPADLTQRVWDEPAAKLLG